MKKLIALVALLGLILGMAATASAELDVKARGSWRVHFNFLDNFDFNDNNAEDDFSVQQRIRTRLRFVFNENVMGELYTEIGDVTWGQGSAGDINTDGIAIEVKRAFIQWYWPGTKALFTTGLMGVNLPTSGFGRANMAIGGIDAGAFQVSVPFNEMVAITLGYTRLLDNNTSVAAADEFDAIYAAVPVTLDGLKLVPYFAYAWFGDDIDSADLPGNIISPVLPADNSTFTFNADGDDENFGIFWLGTAIDVDMFDPFVFHFDAMYGHTQADTLYSGTTKLGDDVDISGWMMDLMFEYTGLDFFTPQLFFAWASGVDKDDFKSGDIDEIGLMPIANSDWGIGGTLINGSNFTTDFGAARGGFWLAGAALRDISFIEKLSHEFIIYYAQGTSDKETVLRNGTSLTYMDSFLSGVFGLPFTDDESYVEVDFNHKYQIYESLAAILELAYGRYSTDNNDVETLMMGGDDSENLMKAAFGFVYSF